MSRFLAPAFLSGVGIWVWHHNQGGADVVVFPWLDWLVGPDPVAQGQFTWKLLLVLAAVTLVVSTISTIRARKRAPMPPNGEQL